METRDVVIVGGGPAGLAAAVELYKKGIRNVLIVEREKTMGGILRQCIHDGFGLTRFGETLSGPEYAQKFIDKVMELKIPYVTDTTVLSVSPDKVVTLASSNGLKKIQAKAAERGQEVLWESRANVRREYSQQVLHRLTSIFIIAWSEKRS